MTRVPTLAAHNLMSARLMTTQSRIYDLQTQLSTEKKSQTYSGISSDALRLVNFENISTLNSAYITNNTVANTRLSAMSSSVDGARSSLITFRDDLSSFLGRDLTDMSDEETADFEALQDRAFNILKDIESYLDIKLDGQYLFSGGKNETAPISVPFSSVEEYQKVYDGNTITSPESRFAHMNDTQLNSSDTGALAFSSSKVYDNADTGTVNFDAVNDYITGNPGAFSDMKSGISITIAGSGNGNDGTYTVTDVTADGSRLTLSPPFAGTGAGAAAMTITRQDVGTITAGTAGAFNLQSYTTAATGSLSVNAGNGTITATTAGAFTNVEAGMVIQLDGSTNDDRFYTVTGVSSDGRTLSVEPPPASSETIAAGTTVSVPAIQLGQMNVAGTNTNNRTYTVTGVSPDGTTLTVTPPPVTETVAATGDAQLSNDIYYKGGETVVEHRVSDTRSIELGINAKDGAVEKAIRAIGMVIQGMPVDSTTGKVDGTELTRRLNEALDIATDAVQHEVGNTGESSQDFSRLENLLANNQVVLNRAITNQKTYSTFLATRVTGMENADKLEVAARINDESTALQISYAAMSMVNQLTLLNYMD